jgi:alpha-acetolactate decarboxylase
MEAVKRQRIKSLADFINTISAGTFIVGFITPIAMEQVNGTGQFLLGLLWVGLSIGGHVMARAVLGGLTE